MDSLRLVVHYSRKIIKYAFRRIRISLMSVAQLGIWALSLYLRILLLLAADKTDRSFLLRTFETSKNKLRELCHPTSFHIPMASSMLALIYLFRSLEDHHMSLPGNEEYQKACPEGSRRTLTGGFVKLFAATVTTVGVHGHLGSLNGSHSWKRELFRAIEVSTNPLAPVFLFSTNFWYGFIDLLRIRPGPWETKMSSFTIKYRFVRLCGCCFDITRDVERSFSLAAFGPHHLKATPRKRDLTWVGRLLMLLILLGQYCQAAVVLIRRIISNTAARVDYAMFLIVLSGLAALCQSITISLLNVSWTFDYDVQPRTEPLCVVPKCVSFKKEQGLQTQDTRPTVFGGRDIMPISQTILHQLAGGYAQWLILSQSRHSFWSVSVTLWIGQRLWRLSIYYILCIDYLMACKAEDQKLQFAGILGLTSYQQQSKTLPASISDDSQGTPDQQQLGRLPVPVPNSSQGASDQHQSETSPIPVPNERQGTSDQEESEILVAVFIPFMFIVGMLAVIWLCIVVIFQLFFLVVPLCLSLFSYGARNNILEKHGSHEALSSHVEG